MPAASAVVGVADRLFVVGPGCSSSGSPSGARPLCSLAAALGPVAGGSLARSLASVASALRLSTKKSIVVLDELGAGTLSADGAGLAAAAAASLGAKRARALLPTHHGELAQSSLMSRLGEFDLGSGLGGSGGSSSLAGGVGVASMKVLVREVEEEEGEENKSKSRNKTLLVTPLFRLEPAPDGPAPAYGLAAAAAAGMPAAVVRRAAEVAAAIGGGSGGGGRGAGARGRPGDFSSSACDPRLAAASARAAGRAATLLARVATLPVASAQGGRLCEEARALLEEALLEGGEGGGEG